LEAEALSGRHPRLADEDRFGLCAAAHGRAGNEQARYDVLHQACSEYPHSWLLRFDLADFLSSRGYDKGALELLGQGLDQPNVPPELYRRLSLVFAKLERVDEARNPLQLYAATQT
jgi:hypothetical protein